MQSVFDLTFTVQDNGAADAADAADRPGRDRRLDRARSGGARQAHRRTRSDRHRAAGLDADLLPCLRAADNHHGQHRSQRRRFQRRGRVRADRLAGPHLCRLGSDHTDRKVEAYSVTVSKQMCDKPMAPDAVGAGRRHRPLGPDDPARLGVDRRRARAVPGRHAGWHAAGQGIDRSAVLAARDFRTAARCSAAPLPPRAASARPTGSSIELEDPVLKRSIRPRL